MNWIWSGNSWSARGVPVPNSLRFIRLKPRDTKIMFIAESEEKYLGPILEHVFVVK